MRLLNWLQSFIDGLLEYKVLYQPYITGKKKFKWNPILNKSFITIKQTLKDQKHKLIYHPSSKLHYCIDIDASNTGFGCVIYQIGKQGMYPIEYYSSMFNVNQIRWHSTAKELFAVVQCLIRFERYYFNKTQKIYIFTDLSEIY